MARYRKRPVEIEARKFSGEPTPGFEQWVGEAFESWVPTKRQLIIRTLEGEMTASAGDYVIRGVEGEVYPCKPSIFEQTYELVSEKADV